MQDSSLGSRSIIGRNVTEALPGCSPTVDAASASYQTIMAFESEGVGMSSTKHPAVMFCYLLATEPVADTQ